MTPNWDDGTFNEGAQTTDAITKAAQELRNAKLRDQCAGQTQGAGAALGRFCSDPTQLLRTATMQVSQLQAALQQLKTQNGIVAAENITLRAELEQLKAVKSFNACVNAWNAVFDKCLLLNGTFCNNGKTGQESVLDFIDKLAKSHDNLFCVQRELDRLRARVQTVAHDLKAAI